MSNKTDDEIQREKDAVQKMVGAKSAMEVSLARIKRLEDALGSMAVILDDAARAVGDGLYIKTHHSGVIGNGPHVVALREQLKRVSAIARNLI